MLPLQSKPFPSAAAFRAWLERNHGRATQLWVGFYNRRSTQSGSTYCEALDEALCFGWIDGVRRSVNPHHLRRALDPRRPNCDAWDAWRRPGSGCLSSASRTPSYPERRTQLSRCYEKPCKAHARAWNFFCAQPPWYQRTSSFWVLSAKREATRNRRLQILIADWARGQRLKGLARKSDRAG